MIKMSEFIVVRVELSVYRIPSYISLLAWSLLRDSGSGWAQASQIWLRLKLSHGLSYDYDYVGDKLTVPIVIEPNLAFNKSPGFGTNCARGS